MRDSDDLEKREPEAEDTPAPDVVTPAPDEKLGAPAPDAETPAPGEALDVPAQPLIDELLAGEEPSAEDDFHPRRRVQHGRLEGARSGGRKKKEPTTAFGRLWREYGYLVVTVAAVFVLFRLIFQLAYVPTGSMETTLPTHSLLISWRVTFLVSDPVPDRGDIVTFWSDELGELLVKRVIGLPGDTITFVEGEVYVNDVKLKEPYLDDNQTTKCDKSFTVPDGCLFFLGDNRTGSYDARSWNEPFIPLEKVQAHALLAISVGKYKAWTGAHIIA